MIKHFKNLLSPIMMALVLTVPQMVQAMDTEEEKAVVLFPNSNLTTDVQELILKTTVKDSCYEFGFAGNLALFVMLGTVLLIKSDIHRRYIRI